jgi:hypothetical protein
MLGSSNEVPCPVGDEVDPVHSINAVRRVEDLLHIFLISALDVAEWSASMPDRFNPGVFIEKGLSRSQI